MEVIEVVKHVDAYDKIHYLQLLRDDIGEYAFRNAVAKIYAKHFIETKRYKGKKVNREDILFVVNIRLKSLDCEEVSYSFIRDIDESIAHQFEKKA